ncbi:crossover junction endodeoxyribonuclease RuvC [Metabacillus fastidiosus]|uniref:crossover junction endodeoxyribonuclease RuvC n=1 Tax=Metabacillus fastidiosus TaxID=1458 RepID=UPI003D2709F0
MSYLYALDLSMDNTGVTVFNLETKEPVHISSISTKKKDSHGIRLYHIAEELLKLRVTYKASVVAIERGFNRFNTATQVIYRVHGLANYLFHDVEQIYYPPKTVKEAIIRGDASKKVVRQMIENKYPNIQFDDEDQSDAFAVGITYLIKNKLIKWEKKLVKSNT